MLGVNNAVLGEQEEQEEVRVGFVLPHGFMLNMGHEGAVHPIVLLWLTCIHLHSSSR